METDTLTSEFFKEQFKIWHDSLVAIMDGKFHEFGVRLGKVEVRLGAVEVSLAVVEVSLATVEVRLGKVETRLGAVEGELVEIKDNMKNLVVRQELAAFPTRDEVSSQIARMTGKRSGGFSVAEDGHGYSVDHDDQT